MTVVDLLRLRKQLSRLLRWAACEKTVIAVAGDESVARLVSPAQKEPRRPGLAPSRLTEAFFDPVPADELAAWER
jgi:hypothetical protein